MMTLVKTILCFLCIAYSCVSYGFEDTGGFYREEIFQANPGQTCGSLCISNPNYFEGYIYQQERNSRLFGPGSIDITKEREEEKITALNYKKLRGRDRIQGLGWGPDSKVNKFFTRQSVRWSRVARDAGFQVAENDRSLGSALWRETRKPILSNIRERLTRPYRSKKLKLGEKVQVWLLEQAVDTGASSLDLDSFGGVQGRNANVDFDISDLIVKFNPRLDPFKGKYGIRFKAQKYSRKNRPIFMGVNVNYCNSDTGFGDRLCSFEHEFSTNFSFINPSKRWSCAAYVSYQTESLDEDAYLIDGQIFDHQPWVGGVTVTYSFY